MHAAVIACYFLLIPPDAPLAAFPAVPAARLKEAGLPADGASLLMYLRERLLQPGDAEKLAGLVKQLGDRSFAARKKASDGLVAAGPKAMPFLRNALADADAEVRKRAQACMAALERQSALLPLAVQQLVHDRPGLEMPVLLGLASISAGPLEDAVLSAMAILTIQRGPDSALIAALKADDPAQRAAAALTLGRFGAGYRDPLRPLTKDADARVRYAVALSLLAGGEKPAATRLANLLDDGDADLANRAESVLLSLAGEHAPAIVANATPAVRKEVWQGWCRLNGDRLDTRFVNDWLPPISMPGRATAFARKSIGAMRNGDTTNLRPMLAPQFLFGTGHYQTENWLENQVRAGSISPQFFRGLKVVPFSRYADWARSPREMELVNQKEDAAGWAVLYAPSPQTWGTIFVHQQRERFFLSGISIDRFGRIE